MNQEVITKENYRTNHEYMSYSRVSRYLKCEAAAVANYHEPTSPSQLVGSYVDAYFSNELDEFKQEHPEIFNSRTGELKADFVKAQDIIHRIESDEEFMYWMDGEKQKIFVGEICGVKFKAKLDVYKEDEAIVDLKVMKDFNRVWSDAFGGYVNFVKAYDYDIEMAIFQELVYQNTGKKLPCYLAAVTKETPSDIGLFEISQDVLDDVMESLERYLKRIKRIQNGEVAPQRCEKCAYCRMTKKAQIMDYTLIGASGDQLREEGYECVDPKVRKEEQ
ncbi:MAG: PD-(D/E)XK nuclease-like domain-containing protein [Bacilli bacterium]|nr:PD-(D/E)XK nuclease-like domain-containing protein [Bacilli bacterium]